MSVAFFDLDRTVLDVNSGHLWLVEEWRTGRVGVREAVVALWWFGRYALGADDLEPALEQAAAIYAGLPAQAMTDQVDRWFQHAIQPRIRPGALAALQAHRDRGDTLVLATSSSQFVAACAQQAWDFDHALATELTIADGRLTGAITTLGFGHHKLDQCARWAQTHGASLDDATFYTDSYSDISLLERVGHPVVVAPDRRLARVARERAWPVADWGDACPSPR